MRLNRGPRPAAGRPGASRARPCRAHRRKSRSCHAPPGLEVTATVELIAVEGKKLTFKVEAHDGVDLISRGVHERFVINKQKFDARIGAKASSAPAR